MARPYPHQDQPDRQITTINDEYDDHYDNDIDDQASLLVSPSRHTSGASSVTKATTYGAVKEGEGAELGGKREKRGRRRGGNSRTFSGGEDALMTRKERGRDNGGDGEKGATPLPKPGSPDFPTSRARAVLLTMYILHRFSDTSGTLDLQYMHSRFSQEFFNGSSASLQPSSVSQCLDAAADAANSSNDDPMQALDDALQQSLSRFQMYLAYASIVPMFLSVIFFGCISDMVGRRWLIVLPMFINVCTSLWSVLIIRFELDLNFMYVGYVAGGMVGSGYVVVIGVFAYTADITPDKQSRTFAIAVVEFVSALSGVFGSIAVGYMIQDLGYFYSVLFPFCFKVASFCLAFFFLPETVPQRVQGIRPSRGNPFKYLKNLVGFYVLWGTRRQRVLFSLCTASLLILFVGGVKYTDTWTIYVLDQPFCFDSERIGFFLAVTGGVTQTMAVVMLKVLQRCLSDEVILILGVVSRIAYFCLTGVAQNTLMLYVATALSVGSNYILGVNRSLLSTMAGPEQQGALFASMAVVEVASNFLSNTLYNNIYQATVSTMRGAVFVVMGAGNILSIFIMIAFIVVSRKEVDPAYQKIIPPTNSDIFVISDKLRYNSDKLLLSRTGPNRSSSMTLLPVLGAEEDSV